MKDVLELAKELVLQMEADKHRDQPDLLEVQLLTALEKMKPFRMNGLTILSQVRRMSVAWAILLITILTSLILISAIIKRSVE